MKKAAYRIIDVNAKNLADYPQVICFINPKNTFYGLKRDWLKKRFAEGLAIKVLLLENDKKISGFIEYAPGEFAWRAVSAKDYLLIHCLWVYANKNKRKGYGSDLVEDVIKDARKQRRKGVAVVASLGSFMAKKELFVKNGFEVIEERDGFQLLALHFPGEKPSTRFNDTQKALSRFRGWHVLYSKQCPWVARFIEELKPIIKQLKIRMTITELRTAQDAQHAPSLYSTFNLIKDGRLLADRYISVTRFKNILKKEGR